MLGKGYKIAKRHLKKEKNDKFWYHFNLTLERYGEPRKNFLILDRKEMTYQDIQLAIRIVAPHPQFPGQTRSKAIPSIPERFIPNDVFVMWSYEKRESVSGPTILPDNRTRPFCQNLIERDRLYDRSAINRMDNDMGLPVFEAGGGFWNDNGEIKPHCRHTWVQNLVRRI